MGVCLRRSGVLVAAYGLPPAALSAVKAYMQYDRREMVNERGRCRIVSTPTRMWFEQADGNLLFPCGFIPRVCGILQTMGVPVDSYERTDRHPHLEFDLRGVACNQLRPEQIKMLEAVAENEGGLIVSSTGSGKSYCMNELCAMYPRARIIITAPGVETVGTLCRYLTEKFGRDGVGQMGGGRRYSRRITVSTFDSVLKIDQVDKTDILIADEAHRTPAAKYEQCLMSVVSPAKRFAFTATPSGRHDGAEKVMESLFGPVLVDIPFQQSVVNGSIVPIHLIVKEQPYGPSYADLQRIPVGPRRDRVAIWRNNQRNQMIAQDVRDLMAEFGDPQTLILVEKTEHALILSRLLPDFFLVYGDLDAKKRQKFESRGLLDPGEATLTFRQREEARKKFETGELRRVIATQVFSTGVSADQCQVVAVASGGGSVIQFIQSIGRGTRKCDAIGKTHCTVLLWRDTFGQNDKGYAPYKSRADKLISAAKKEGHYMTSVPCT